MQARFSNSAHDICCLRAVFVRKANRGVNKNLAPDERLRLEFVIENDKPRYAFGMGKPSHASICAQRPRYSTRSTSSRPQEQSI